MTRAEKINILLEEYQERLEQEKEEQNQRIDEAEALDPEIARLRDAMLKRTFFAATALVRKIGNLSHEPFSSDSGSDSENEEDPVSFREKSLANMHSAYQEDLASIRKHLEKLHLPPDYLDMHYTCPLCQDTGYIDEAHTTFCSCLEKALVSSRWNDVQISSQTFEGFDPRIFPTDKQLKEAERVAGILRRYADTYPDNPKPNILLIGQPGLGKTFLFNCLINCLQKRGEPTMYITAFKMMMCMRAVHMDSNPEQSALFQDMQTAPLLVIDDLGSEPQYNNISIEYLTYLLDERIQNRRHTLIATNLTFPQIQNRYGERISSRLGDKCMNLVIQMTGSDLRITRSV